MARTKNASNVSNTIRKRKEIDIRTSITQPPSHYELMGHDYAQSLTDFNLSLGFITENDIDADWYRQSRVGYGNFSQVDQINAVMEKKKGLILGSVITQLAINHGLLDLQQHSLHKAHDNAPLDEKSLERMGIIEKKDGVYRFRAPSTPLLPKELCRQLKRSRVEVHDPLEDPNQSTLTPPTPTTFEVMQKLDQIAQDVSRIRSDINAYFVSKNFYPPPSTS
ncbi:hypothetical protein C2S53_020752 [Perilla frutescens var. hirtella]|uniref:Uncharacterized protein n=1 Tax=Perilla frutescens var. hirtella TaxID=608512 RepID=A0AAD4P088_PERFH|nr:hypothetical protein C2S53_020752 [Perilla frutescens var. hirtella]